MANKYLDYDGVKRLVSKLKTYITNAVKVTGVKGNAESTYRTGNVNITAANVGAVATTGNETVAGDKTFTGITTIQTDNRSTIYAPPNTILPANPVSLLQSPIPKYLWHDVLAFCRIKTPTYYTSADGETWTEATLNKQLFAHKEKWGASTVLSSTITGSRWVWLNAGLYASNVSWLVLGITYAYPTCHFDLSVETSSDGESTWTSLCSLTNAYYNQTPIWIKTSGTCQSSLRITIIRNSSSAENSTLKLGSIRYLTNRWGDQGQGSEYEHPYTWDSDFNLSPLSGASFVGNLTGNATSATNASKVNNHTVNSDVPANALFTDTVTTATATGSGNAVTAISSNNGALTIEKGATFVTASEVQTMIDNTIDELQENMDEIRY